MLGENDEQAQQVTHSRRVEHGISSAVQSFAGCSGVLREEFRCFGEGETQARNPKP